MIEDLRLVNYDYGLISADWKKSFLQMTLIWAGAVSAGH